MNEAEILGKSKCFMYLTYLENLEITFREGAVFIPTKKIAASAT